MRSDQKTRSLPRPQRERWQPLRSGFLNLYRYDREEFHYENGRLLLRGNNGTGKSRVLALQLPFLLDGEVVPQRLEPDADPAKRVEWNLLMGRYPDRTGYTWIEFGRRDNDGTEHYITLGCGLNAVEYQSGVRKWFFITSQRIGQDLELASDGGHVFGKDRLREKIGDDGQVFEDVGAYRHAVNDALFHLDDYRYASLINLLIQLRRPQLTRRLEETELSEALSEALPPVSPTIIANVAEAFRNLESDRSKLESFKTALTAADRFLNGYRRYAEVAAKRRVDRVRRAHFEYETGMKEILVSEADCDRSLAELARLKAELQRVTVEQHAVQAEISALQQSPHMKDPHALERAQREAKEKRKEAEAATAELADAALARTNRSEEHVRIKDALQKCLTRLKTAKDAAAQAAADAGLENVHRDLMRLFEVPNAAAESELKTAREDAETAIQTKLKKIEHVQRLDERIRTAKNELQQSRACEEQLSGLLEDARERLNASQQEQHAAITAFLNAVGDWKAQLTELRPPNEEEFANALFEWCESPQSSNPFTHSVRLSIEELSRTFAEQGVALEQLKNAQMAELLHLRDERERLASEEPIHVHAARPGAPLCRLCDFADDVDVAAQAGIEAALEGAGLLHAWVMPSGDLLIDKTADQVGKTVLVIASTPLPPEDAHLGMLLVPAFDSLDATTQVPPYVVADILRHIGASPNAGNTWVSPDGQWQNGPIAGSSTKPEAEYIGQTAREMARSRRILELDTVIAEAQSNFELLTNSLDELNRREQAARIEAAAAPSDDEVRTVHERVLSLGREADGLRNRLSEAKDHVAQKQSTLDEANDTRNRAATDLGFAKWAEDLSGLEKALAHYRFQLSLFWVSLEAFRDTQMVSERTWSRVEEAAARERRQKEIAERMERAAHTLEVTYENLRQSVGADLDQILHRLEHARRQLEDLRAQEKELRRLHHDTELAVTRVDERLRNRTEMLNGQTDRRDTAAASLRAFGSTRLLHLAAPGTSDADAMTWSAARTVEVAFDVASRLESIECSDPTWDHYQKSVPTQFNELMRTLSAQGCQPSATFWDDVFVASALFAGQESTMEELRQILAEEVLIRQMLLEAKEKEILENHLVGEVRNHLHELLKCRRRASAANEHRARKPSNEHRHEIALCVAALEGAVRHWLMSGSRLMRSDSTWSPADRQMLGHVPATSDSMPLLPKWRVEPGRSHWPKRWITGSGIGLAWNATRTVSGSVSRGRTSWHRFRWRKSRRAHAAAFRGCRRFLSDRRSTAPRLILLDEAFVGIDADMRAKCMGSSTLRPRFHDDERTRMGLLSRRCPGLPSTNFLPGPGSMPSA